MKRYGNLFDKITDMDNIRLAHAQAQRGKKHYTAVKKVNTDPESFLLEIQRLLISGDFTTSAYRTEEIFDGKKQRIIHKLPYYPDRIVQHAVMNICAPIWRKSFIRDTYQSIEGRGCHDARRRINTYLAKAPKHHAIKLDIHKYYPSVPNVQMKLCIRKSIKCLVTLAILDNIIDSHNGLPIGNYTSQYLGNLYLNNLDWWAKQESGVGAYFRYCDDIVLMDTSSAKVHKVLQQVIDKIELLGLEVKPDIQYRHVEGQGLDFCGFVFFGKATRLRTRIMQNLKLAAAGATKSKVLKSLMSYWGWVKPIDAKALWRTVISTRLLNFTDGVFTNNPLRATI